MILKVIFSLFATLGVVFSYELASDAATPLSNTFISTIIFLLYLLLFSKIGKITRKEKVFSGILSFILALIIIIGSQLEKSGEIIWSALTIFKLICASFSCVPILLNGLTLLKKYQLPETISKKDIKHIKLITFLIIFGFGLLVFLALYPGVYGYDAGYQILEFIDGKSPITTHFSIPFSFVLSHIVQLGNTLFGSYNVGLGMFCFLQMTFMSYVATSVSLFVRKITKNRTLFILSTCFFCVFPFFTVMSISTAQDTVFAGFFALLFIKLYSSVFDNKYWSHKSNIIITSLLILALCLARNNGLYIMIVATPLIIIITNKNRRMLTAATLILPLIIYLCYNITLPWVLSVQKGDSIREMSSIPTQQIARALVRHHDSMSEDLVKEINYYYDTKNFISYYELNPSISDAMKAVIKSNNVKNNPAGYLWLWIRLGVSYPEDYLEAFAMNTLGFWYPNKNYPDSRMYHPLLEYDMLDLNEKTAFLDLRRESKIPIYENFLQLVVGRNAWKRVPIISTLFTMGFYFIVFVVLLALTIFYKNWRYLIPLSIIIGLYITLFLSPVALLRYCFPIIVLFPAIISLGLRAPHAKNL